MTYVGAVDELLAEHPDLEPLLERGAPAVQVEDAAAELGRYLVGQPRPESAQPLTEQLFELAPGEMTVLQGLCKRHPLRAVTTALTLLEHLLPVLPEEPPEEDHEEPPPEEDEEPSEEEDQEPPEEESDADSDHGEAPLPASLVSSPAVGEALLLAGIAAEADMQLEAALATLLPGAGWDFSRAALSRALLGRLEQYLQLLERTPELARIADRLGRLEAAALRRRRPERGGRESIVGVRVGGELEDVLPCELALLGDEETEDLFYQRLLERRLLSWELAGDAPDTAEDPDRRGPVIVCVDTSASMEGAPEELAKAFLLAVARRLLPNGRPLHVTLFGGPGDKVHLDLRPGRSGLAGLLEFLALGFHAGTDFDGPLLYALELLEQSRWERADLLVVTDGLCRASGLTLRRLEERRRQQSFRVVAAVVAPSPGGAADFAEELWCLDPAGDPETGVVALESAF